MCVGKRKLLIRELPGESCRFGQRIAIERLNREDRQGFDEAEELHGTGLIVTAEEPTVAFGDYEGRGRQARRIGLEASSRGSIDISTQSFELYTMSSMVWLARLFPDS